MKLAGHNIPVHWSNADANHMRRIRPKSIKLVDFHPARTRQFYELSPASLFVLRNHPLSEQKADAMADPEGTARRHARQWMADLADWHLPIPKERIVVLGLNEFPIWWDDDGSNANTPQAKGIDILNRYSAVFAEELSAAGIRFGLGNINTGWPANEGPDTPPNWNVLEPIRDALHEAHARYNVVGFLFLHEYWPADGPESVWPWNAGRYTQCPWNVPIIIGECGMTQRLVDGSIPEDASGWLQFLDADSYWAQLRWYDEQIQKDHRIHSAQVFTWDAFHPFVKSDDIRGLLYKFPVNSDFDHMLNFYDSEPVPPPPPTPQPGAEPLLWPLANRRITQHFVGNYDWYSNVSAIGHNGTDYGAETGTPILAVAAGVVAWVDWDDGWGWYVRIYHERYGFHSFYAHMVERSPLHVGQMVKRGDTIGKVGNTGRSTGPHLHYSVRLAQADSAYISSAVNLKGYVDPVLFHAWVNEHVNRTHDIFLPIVGG